VTRRLLAILALSALVGGACRDKPSEPDPSPRPATTGPSTPYRPSALGYEVPHGWTATKPRPMIQAAYSVPKAEGDAENGELGVSQAGGSVDQNIARWAQQLEKKPADATRSKRTVNGLEVTVVEIRGDYTGMAMPGAPAPAKKPGFALLGAIFETTPPTFFKLVGPERTIVAARADFDQLVASLRAK
jgi:hypothetical protein